MKKKLLSLMFVLVMTLVFIPNCVNAEETHTVTFKANGFGGDANGNMLVLEVNDGTKLEDIIEMEDIEKLNPYNIIKDGIGYKVRGYYKTPNYSGDILYDFASEVITSDLTLYAWWEVKNESYFVVDNNKLVTEDNKNDILNNGTVSYDSTTKTLKLNGYNGGFISVPHDVTVYLEKGTNNIITIPENINVLADGIEVEGNLIITGEGNLTININNEFPYGISTTYTLNNEGGNLAINIDGDLKINSINDGIVVFNSLTINSKGNITINSTEGSGIWSVNDITISGSGNTIINAYYSAFDFNKGHLIIKGTGAVRGTSKKSDVVDADCEGYAVELNGNNPLVIFETENSKRKAVDNWHDRGLLVGGSKLNSYIKSGNPEGQVVSYFYASKITSANINIKEPKVGETPSANPTIISDPLNKVNIKEISGIGKASWAEFTNKNGDGDKTNPDNYDFMIGKTFESGKTYAVAINIELTDITYFLDPTIITINNKIPNMDASSVMNTIIITNYWDLDSSTPVITSGANQEWLHDGKDLIVISDANFKDFIEVRVDDKKVDAKNYTVVSGSTKVTLKSEYLETLSIGTHTLEIVSNNGKASTSFTIKTKPPVIPITNNENKTTNTNNSNIENPKTFDGGIFGYVGLTIIALVGIIGGTVVYKKKQTN